MTSRGPGRASRTLEMEEKELLRRQIRLLQGASARAGRGSRLLPSPDYAAGPRPPPEGGRSPPAVSAAGSGGWRRGQAGGGGRRASRPARPAPCLGRRCGPVRRRGAGRLGGRLVTGGRRPPPHGGRVLACPGPRAWGGGSSRREQRVSSLAPRFDASFRLYTHTPLPSPGPGLTL